jgi:hypothetical protein
MSATPNSSLAVRALAICLRETGNKFANDLADTINDELKAEGIHFNGDWDQAGISEWTNSLRRFIPKPSSGS